jgi:hypothetical protein
MKLYDYLVLMYMEQMTNRLGQEMPPDRMMSLACDMAQSAMTLYRKPNDEGDITPLPAGVKLNG